MASDRATLEAEVKYTLGNRTDLDPDITRWVKRAYQALTQRVEFRESLAQPTTFYTAASGTRNYNLPSDFFSIYMVKNLTKDKRLIQETPSRYMNLSSTHQGSAERYAIFNSEIWVYKKPDAAEQLQLWYRRVFPDLTNSTSTHLLKDAWDEPIIWEASAYGFDALGEVERAIALRRNVAFFIKQQQPALIADLVDRNEAMEVIH